MENSTTKYHVSKIFEKYDELCTFCDTFWDDVKASYSKEIVCKKGCHICCELTSVNFLECCLVVRELNSKRSLPSFNKSKSGSCVFIAPNGSCIIYKSRPTICRTHGLLISSYEFKHTAVTCNFNFQNHDPNLVDKKFVLDHDSITLNLVKLNLALSILSGNEKLAEKRFTFKNILSKKYPKEVDFINSLLTKKTVKK